MSDAGFKADLNRKQKITQFTKTFRNVRRLVGITEFFCFGTDKFIENGLWRCLVIAIAIIAATVLNAISIHVSVRIRMFCLPIGAFRLLRWRRLLLFLVFVLRLLYFGWSVRFDGRKSVTWPFLYRSTGCDAEIFADHLTAVQ